MRQRFSELADRQGLRLLFAAVILVMAGLGCANGGGGDGGGSAEIAATASSGSEVKIFITDDPNGPRCMLADEEGNIDVAVKPGDTVVWINQYGQDVDLTFGPSKRLFGVLKARAYSTGSPLRLQVREDAEVQPQPHKYSSNCGTTEPPPGIIVNPPGGGGG